ncbi:DUF1963 domain-containing protein [Niabella sp. CC-SYL272]|uniref:DUF1963 domain-containing protein n=1 Tax=Niabella agricola TaxID=2891571 RepID=UPI001F3BED69|nr:DUF1963 domain-containing protein [Niabella agricola]MCF3108907.1 DUF1963 domain-containing protein [Niabella agricola]
MICQKPYIADRYCQVFRNGVRGALFLHFSPVKHKLGGYAYFTQRDLREGDALTADYLLLFQMGSDEHIMWGDAGVGNFFIAPVDFANKDFSGVFYNWDCR